MECQYVANVARHQTLSFRQPQNSGRFGTPVINAKRASASESLASCVFDFTDCARNSGGGCNDPAASRIDPRLFGMVKTWDGIRN